VSLARSLQEAWEVPRDLLLGRYPPFVTGGPLPRGDIPVFVLHGAEPRSLETQLRHLDANGYATLTADEYLAVMRGEQAAPECAVLLTFDDGRGSLWGVAAPLLERFGMKAVVFLVPGRMRSQPGPLLPTWADVEAGRVVADEVLEREAGEGALLSWEEVESLSSRGVFDFQSHTLTHARVHSGGRLAGFATPWSRRGYDAFDQPLVRQGDRDLLGEQVPLGTPLFESAPRTSESLRFFEDPAARAACVAAVESEGEGFFRRADWASVLGRLMPRTPVPGRLETRDEQVEAIERELTESRRLIEEHLGRPVTHLCYPWHAFGPTASRLAASVGYQAVFCGKVRGVPITRPGGDLRRIARLGEDYLALLPGKGRSTLRQVLQKKWGRRFGAGRAGQA
jgi:peptidoglycan/xylan/chitin deacetylase (PgdA/CDA1 family)